MEDKDCKGNCNINLSDESEYEYILNELELTRNRIDDIIKIIRQRTEKDAIINEVLKCSCDDAKKNNSNIDIEETLKMLALKEMLKPYKSYYPTYYRYQF